MPNDPDNRSAILNSVFASGIRAESRPPIKARTSGWTVSPSATPLPQSSGEPHRRRDGEYQQSKSARREQCQAARDAVGEQRRAVLAALDHHVAEPAGQAHDYSLRQQYQPGNRRAAVLDAGEEHRGEKEHGE